MLELFEIRKSHFTIDDIFLQVSWDAFCFSSLYLLQLQRRPGNACAIILRPTVQERTVKVIPRRRGHVLVLSKTTCHFSQDLYDVIFVCSDVVTI